MPAAELGDAAAAVCGFPSLCGLLNARLARGCRPQKDGSSETQGHDGKGRGQICLNWRFFWHFTEKWRRKTPVRYQKRI